MTKPAPSASQVHQVLESRLPMDHRDVLCAHSGEQMLTATCIEDPLWLAEQVRLRGQIWGIDDQRVLAVLWWYSASTVLVTPLLASLVTTGIGLSGRLEDLVLHHLPSSRLTGSHATAVSGSDIQVAGDQLARSFDSSPTRSDPAYRDRAMSTSRARTIGNWRSTGTRARPSIAPSSAFRAASSTGYPAKTAVPVAPGSLTSNVTS